jgi:CheY-like chemotaxis protein
VEVLQAVTPEQPGAQPAVVLFVDDEASLCQLFVKRFEKSFVIHTASNGQEGLDVLAQHPEIDVVVTDIRMPVMSGLDFIREAKAKGIEASFIVVSGHADAGDVIQALRNGARNFLQKPYPLNELEQSIVSEVKQLREFRAHQVAQARERELDRLVVSVERLAFGVPNDLSWVSPLAFRLVGLVGAGFSDRQDVKMNVALGLIEMITNAIEHGNLGVGGREKIELKSKGGSDYEEELKRRASTEPYRSRQVHVTCSMDADRVVFQIADEGKGFDVSRLPDPTDPENLFAPSGRGILLTRAFMDEVHYEAHGNQVTLIKYRKRRDS